MNWRRLRIKFLFPDFEWILLTTSKSELKSCILHPRTGHFKEQTDYSGKLKQNYESILPGKGTQSYSTVTLQDGLLRSSRTGFYQAF